MGIWNVLVLHLSIGHPFQTDSGTITQSLVGIGTFNEFKSLTKARITCSANNGDQSDLTYFYDQIRKCGDCVFASQFSVNSMQRALSY